MEWGYILQKTNTAKGEIDIEYLDETSSLKASFVSRKTGESIEQTREKAVQNLQSIEYISKEESGRVNAAGFLRDMLLRKGGKAPDSMDNEERKQKISAAIRKHIGIYGRYRGACAHKIVMSMSSELNDKIKKAGLNPDMVLISHMKKVMKDFQDKFYPQDRIGYAYGLHHDTDHLHAHIYLVNRTEKGRHVAYSRPLKGKSSPRRQLDQMGFCDARLNKITADFVKKLDRKEQIKEAKLQAIQAAESRHSELLLENDILMLSLQEQYKKLMELEKKIINKYIPPSRRVAKMAGLSFDIVRGMGVGRKQAFKEKRSLRKQYFSLKRKYFYDLAVFNNGKKKVASLGQKLNIPLVNNPAESWKRVKDRTHQGQGIQI